ncbi:DUF6428 family protein [Parapedobacter sp. GCM10030251]|uniref:DUF6428 family protein n=1 Tax=Parapedobacter sp. GCM10030251 TaxID=3273419 RepID=UPI00360788E9
MKLSEVKNVLPHLDQVTFQLESGAYVPEHFHVTEVGMVTRHFVDCGGTIRSEKAVNFQLWDANDYAHRLKPGKLLNIINLSKEKLGLGDFEVEVEYQADTIGRYRLAFNGHNFVLQNMATACLAQDACGVPAQKAACCTPDSGTCN